MIKHLNNFIKRIFNEKEIIKCLIKLFLLSKIYQTDNENIQNLK